MELVLICFIPVEHVWKSKLRPDSLRDHGSPVWRPDMEVAYSVSDKHWLLGRQDTEGRDRRELKQQISKRQSSSQIIKQLKTLCSSRRCSLIVQWRNIAIQPEVTGFFFKLLLFLLVVVFLEVSCCLLFSFPQAKLILPATLNRPFIYCLATNQCYHLPCCVMSSLCS